MGFSRALALAPWLERPIAHRGLHDAAAGIIENSASAFEAAIKAGYGIETDLQETRGGEPVAFHDAALNRLTDGFGDIASMSAAELRNIPLKGSSDRILSLGETLEVVAGRAPLLLEIKSRQRGQQAFAQRIAAALKGYRGPAAVMSFDPQAVAPFSALSPSLPRGLTAMRFRRSEWPGMGPLKRFQLTHLLARRMVKPHFVAYDLSGLPAFAPGIARHLSGLPILAWTAQSAHEARRVRRWADNIIFEGFRPGAPFQPAATLRAKDCGS